jgi:hypothetical protein
MSSRFLLELLQPALPTRQAQRENEAAGFHNTATPSRAASIPRTLQHLSDSSFRNMIAVGQQWLACSIFTENRAGKPVVVAAQARFSSFTVDFVGWLLGLHTPPRGILRFDGG